MSPVMLPTQIVANRDEAVGILLLSRRAASRAGQGEVAGVNLDRLARIAEVSADGFAIAPAPAGSRVTYLVLVSEPRLAGEEVLAELRLRAIRGITALPMGERDLSVEPPSEDDSGAMRFEMLCEGALAAASMGGVSRLERLIGIGGPELEPRLARVGATASGAAWARQLVELPSSELGPAELADRAAAAAESAGLGVKCWSSLELEKAGFAGLLAVARGSAPPTMVDLTYRRDEPDLPELVLVGKGVTFDNGGMQTKQVRMEWNKADMAGAATVLAAALAVAALNLPIRLRVLVPCAENLGGPSALRPGDVIRHRNGRTSEVRNTDGEGRLILADALHYASELDPAAIIDVATLTNPFGPRVWGYASNDEQLAAALGQASATAGESSWRLLLHHGYLGDLASSVADLANYVPIPSGANDHAAIRAITAALFLEPFAGGSPWAHLDIAGTAFYPEPNNGWPGGASGCAIPTLVRLAESVAGARSPR